MRYVANKYQLKDVCVDFIVPQRDKPKEFNGDIPWCRIEDIEGRYLNGSKSNQLVTRELANQMNMRLCPVGTVICACSASIGNQAITTVECYTNQTFIGIVVDSLRLKNDYLYWFLSSQKEELKRIGTGATIKYISKEKFANLFIPVPPLDVQERIVEELDCLSGVIAKKKEQLKELDALAQSIFYEMFGNPVENDRGWEVKKLGDVCQIICGQDYKSVKDDNGKYPIYGTGGIMGYASQYRCPANSVIIGRKGNINNPLFVGCEFWNVDTAFGVVPDIVQLAPIYFFFFCKNYDFTVHDVSVTIPSLRRVDVLKIDVACPPLSLQQEFASKIESIDKQKELIRKSIEEVEMLFNSRMDYYFG